jgi:hypothetical protein
MDDKVLKRREWLGAFCGELQSVNILKEISKNELELRDSASEKLNDALLMLDEFCSHLTSQQQKYDVINITLEFVEAVELLARFDLPFPVAIAERRRIRNSERGKASGEARRLKAEKGWHLHALELAERARSNFPNGSLSKIAEEISAGWKLNEPECPGHETLKDFISQAIKSGKLLPKTGERTRFS